MVEAKDLTALREAARAQWMSLDRLLGVIIGAEEESEAIFQCPHCGAPEEKMENTSDMSVANRWTCLECGTSFQTIAVAAVEKENA